MMPLALVAIWVSSLFCHLSVGFVPVCRGLTNGAFQVILEIKELIGIILSVIYGRRI